MLKKICLAAAIAATLAGCAAGVNTTQYSDDTRFIGRSYVVMEDHAFRGLRDVLTDRQTIRVVETFRTPQGLLLIKVVDESGNLVADKPYGLSDYGVVDDEVNPIQTHIDQDKISPGITGTQTHGFGNPVTGVDHTYSSSVEQTRMDGMTAQGSHTLRGLGAVCLDDKLFLTVSQKEIIGAPRSEADITIYIDSNEPVTFPAMMSTYTSLFARTPAELESQLLAGKRGAMRVQTISDVVSMNVTLDGFAEMYTRIKNNCGTAH